MVRIQPSAPVKNAIDRLDDRHYILVNRASVAQLAERKPLTLLVVGSIPTRGASLEYADPRQSGKLSILVPDLVLTKQGYDK